MKKLINQLKEQWSKPTKAIHKNEETIQDLACEFSNDLTDFSVGYPFDIPDDLKEFWENTNEAKLFYDVKYGQWGLHILPLNEAIVLTEVEKADRPDEYSNDELIFGIFLGDSEQLLIDCSHENYGRITVSQPIDKRKDWPIIANSFTDFLTSYVEKQGEKFWE